MKTSSPIRFQRWIAVLSILLFMGKMLAWYMTKSVGILTDALESTVNVITAFIGLYSIALAARPRDDNHPYGHGKIEFVSAAIEGALIFLAGIFIIYQAIFNLFHPHALQQLTWGIAIIAATGLLNFLMGKRAVKLGKDSRSATLHAAGTHLLSDAYSTAALVIGLLLVYLLHWLWLDAAVALVFAFFIIYSGVKVLRKSLAGIMDEADMALMKAVVAFLHSIRKDQWIDLHNLRVIQYGDVMHLDAHMTLPWYYEVRQAEIEIHLLEDMVTQHYGGKVEMFVHVDACADFSCKLCCLKDCTVRQHPFEKQLEWTVGNALKDSKHGK